MAAAATPSSGLGACGRCGQKCVAVHCADCCPDEDGLAACHECDVFLHSKTHRAHHVRRPVCADCGHYGATATCARCAKEPTPYCDRCWKDTHDVGTFAQHVRVPVDPLPPVHVADTGAGAGAGAGAGPSEGADGAGEDQDEGEAADGAGEDEDEDEGEAADGAREGEGEGAVPVTTKQGTGPAYVARAQPHPDRTLDARRLDARQLERLRKMLDLAYHPGTPQDEAMHAMRRADVEMAKMGVTAADVTKPTTGNFAVHITPTSSSRVKAQAWFRQLACAVTTFYSVKYYVMRHGTHVAVHMFGLREPAQLATDSYEALFNRMHDLLAQRPDIKGVQARNSYRMGVASGLLSRITDSREQTSKADDAESRAIVVHHDQALVVAKNMSAAMRLRKSRRSGAKRDRAAYEQGVADSCKVQMGQKRIAS